MCVYFQRKKFTLIELLVVIAIIGILSSILIPSLQKARDVTKQAVCVSNLKQQGMAVEMYVTSNNGILPPHLTVPPPYRPPYRPDRLAVYLNGTLENSREVFECPSEINHHPLGDYADNSFHIFPNTMVNAAGKFLTSFKRPTELISHVDSGNASINRGSWWVPCPVTHSTNAIQVSGRHNGKTSVLFLDSHVEIRKRNTVFTNVDDMWGHYSR
ncbi:MAG: prepilin-type N-terminal cleavage/methylation domain-containing protein [Lentisphaeraceae bacterium]|nr:prepilin-type N-terminal cleavage/methylation domain-containing protein [Lentisphaeraceae bacterium]